jgi:hypothetical protein
MLRAKVKLNERQREGETDGGTCVIAVEVGSGSDQYRR